MNQSIRIFLSIFLGTALWATNSCGDQEKDESTTEQTSSTSMQTTSHNATSSETNECTDVSLTFEGCNPITGCGEMPVGWQGTVDAGEDCSSGTDCKGVLCECSDPEKKWWAGVCACGSCAPSMEACNESASEVSCNAVSST